MRDLKLTNQALGDLCRSLSLLLHSGITLSDAMHLLAKEETAPLAQVFTDLGRQLDAGQPLWEALEAAGFPTHTVGMIRVGETTGRTEEALEALADYYQQRWRTGKLLRSAVAYPSMILLLMLLVIFVLLIKVLPVFEEVYASLGSRLTGLAGGLLRLGNALEAALPVILAVLAVLAAGICLFCLCAPVQAAVTGYFTRRFGDRGLLRKFCNARFARALSMGLSSGLSLDESMELASRLLSDTPGAQERCRKCAALLETGTPLPEAMAQTDLLSAPAARMLAVGLKSGSGDTVMVTVAQRMQEDADDTLQAAVSRVEPAMVLAASVLVGIILLSVMLPLMNILSSIG